MRQVIRFSAAIGICLGIVCSHGLGATLGASSQIDESVRNLSRYSVGINNIDFRGKRYKVVVLSPTEFAPQSVGLARDSDDLQSYATRLLEKIQNWVVDQYVEQGRIQAGSELQKALLTTESILADRSSVVAITDGNDLNRVYAVLRIARTNTKTGLLPLEERLHIKLPRPDVRLTPWRESDGTATYHAYGGVIELKNFVKDKSAPEDFISLLLDSAERARVSQNADVIHRTVSSKYAPDEFNGPVVASQYLLECDSKMVNYYTSLGFKTLESYPDRDTYVMATDRLGFVAVGEKFRNRVGYALVWTRSFNETILSHAECESILLGRKP